MSKCIFCLRDSSKTQFSEKPHTMSKSLGSISVGFDICNECNHYFGEPDLLSDPHLAIEVCVKEILGMIKALLNYRPSGNNQTSRTHLKSIYFNFWRSKQKIEIKRAFRYNSMFIKTFTNQFKRGLYEMFLQEYHKETGNGLDPKFDRIREYARYNRGSIPLYYVRNNGAVMVEEDFNSPKFHFSELHLKDINDYGFYDLLLFGQIFYLEVTPSAQFCKDIYLGRKAQEVIGSGFVNERIIEVQKITDIDFTLRKLYGKD